MEQVTNIISHGLEDNVARKVMSQIASETYNEVDASLPYIGWLRSWSIVSGGMHETLGSRE